MGFNHSQIDAGNRNSADSEELLADNALRVDSETRRTGQRVVLSLISLLPAYRCLSLPS